jgi:hypothetical protein
VSGEHPLQGAHIEATHDMLAHQSGDSQYDPAGWGNWQAPGA